MVVTAPLGELLLATVLLLESPLLRGRRFGGLVALVPITLINEHLDLTSPHISISSSALTCVWLSALRKVPVYL